MAKSLWQYPGLALVVAALAVAPAVSQSRYASIPTAASTTLPPGISVKKTPAGDVYVDSQGRVLYGMDTAQLRLRTRTPFAHCHDACAEEWEPVAPPPGTPTAAAAAPQIGLGGIGGGGGRAETAAEIAARARGLQAAPTTGPDWTVIQGAKGPQLLYKRTHLVFVHKLEPTSTKWDASPDWLRDEPVGPLFNALRFVPPVPKLAAAPIGVTPVFINGAYVLVDKDQHVLYTQGPGKCAAACEKPVPFRAGLIADTLGDWSVSRSSDIPQWLYKGKPVYVSQGLPKSADVPAGAAVLHP